MFWEDSAYLLSKNSFSENSVVAEMYTENHGKISGVIYGATSKKIRNYLQIGNKFHINYNFKNETKLGYLKIEIDKILTPNYFDDSKKLSCIISSMHLIKLLTVDNQSNIILADRYMILLTEEISKLYNNPSIIMDVKSSKVFSNF